MILFPSNSLMLLTEQNSTIIIAKDNEADYFHIKCDYTKNIQQIEYLIEIGLSTKTLT